VNDSTPASPDLVRRQINVQLAALSLKHGVDVDITRLVAFSQLKCGRQNWSWVCWAIRSAASRLTGYTYDRGEWEPRIPRIFEPQLRVHRDKAPGRPRDTAGEFPIPTFAVMRRPARLAKIPRCAGRRPREHATGLAVRLHVDTEALGLRGVGPGHRRQVVAAR